MFSRTAIILFTLVAAPMCWAQGADRMQSQTGAKTTIGPRNAPLYDGAQALLAGRHEDGVELTLAGLKLAQGKREEEAALSNLCAGYLMLKQYDEAIKYCDLLLQRNEKSWRGYNNRALIYMATQQYDKADADLKRGETIAPSARTIKIARAMYLDAVDPVVPEVEIDDSSGQSNVDESSENER